MVTIDSHDNLNEAVKLGLTVRKLQQKCKFSQRSTKAVEQVLQEQRSKKCALNKADRKLRQQSGVQLCVLHGCVNVNADGGYCTHVFGPKDKRSTCPKCGHSRYEAGSTTRANEMVYWFPLKPRLEALMKLPYYRWLCQVTSAFNHSVVRICVLVFAFLPITALNFV